MTQEENYKLMMEYQAWLASKTTPSLESKREYLFILKDEYKVECSKCKSTNVDIIPGVQTTTFKCNNCGNKQIL